MRIEATAAHHVTCIHIRFGFVGIAAVGYIVAAAFPLSRHNLIALPVCLVVAALLARYLPPILYP